MKKLLNKLRIWIIHKLGGAYPPDVRMFKTYIQNPIPIRCQVKIPWNELYLSPNFEYTDKIVREKLVFKLAEEIFKNRNLYGLEMKSDQNFEDAVVYRAEILVYERRQNNV